MTRGEELVKLCLPATAFLLLAGADPGPETADLAPGSKVRFATAAEGSRLLSVRDVFVKAMSPVDRGARLKTDRDVSEAEYLAFVARQPLEWTRVEKARLAGFVDAFRAKTERFAMRFPADVSFVKTTGLEEGNAAYCRGATVVLPQRLLDGDEDVLRTTIFHELFHVYRTHNPEKRAALYAIVGFTPVPEIPLPSALAQRKITNPDAPLIDSVVRIARDGRRVAATPLLLATAERYDTKKGGEFFDSMEFKLLLLDESGGRLAPASGADGAPLLLDPSEAPDYLEQIGKNTRYIIHPEEILAENFVLLVGGKRDMPSPRLLKDLEAVLAR
jgi:hypothetical protein